MFGIESIRHPELTLTRCKTWIGEAPGEFGHYTFLQSLGFWKFPRFSVGGFSLSTGHTLRSLEVRWFGHTLQLSIMYRKQVLERQ